MNTLPDLINQEINTLPLLSQKELLDFVLFLKNRLSTQTDTDYLSNNADSKQAIIDGLNTPMAQCSESLNW
jgi:hypothetical protein